MATLFLSYSSADRDDARRLQTALQARKHEVAWDVDALLVGSGWRDALMTSLGSADAAVVLLTPASMASPMVIAEVGAARAFALSERHTALLPVLVGLDEIPSFISDLFVLQAGSLVDAELDRVATEIDLAITAHVQTIDTLNASVSTPRIFVSHRHHDVEVARAVTEVLRAAFEIDSSDIRCTSVQPYRLPFGKNTSERLREEIRLAGAVLGILAPDTAESTYVMFELGAAWGQQVYTMPLLSRGASYGHIPGPIFDLAPARLWVDADCHQLLGDLANELRLTRRSNTDGEVSEKVRKLVEAASPTDRS